MPGSSVDGVSQARWSGLPFLSPGDLPNPQIETDSGKFFTTEPPGKSLINDIKQYKTHFHIISMMVVILSIGSLA